MTHPLQMDGVYPVLPTPFTAEGEILFGDIAREVGWAVTRGASGVVVLGVAGEVFRMNDDERSAVITAAVEAAGDTPVIAGAGNLSTYLAVRSARAAAAAGVSGILVAPPPIGRAPEAEVIRYFDAVASAVDIPLVLQDDPVHLGVGLSVATISDLRRRHENCRFAKLEELPSMTKIRDVAAATNGHVACIGGSGGVYALEELAAGACGIMTGFAFPEALVAIHKAWRSGDRVSARRLNRLISDLARLEALPGMSLAIRKRLYVERGALSTAALRSPAANVDDWTWALVRDELRLLESEWAGSQN